MKQIFINTRESEKRIAVVENDILVQYYAESPSQQSLVGNLYLGIVEKVVPGMNAAFVNIGHGKKGYLHITQIPTYMNASKEIKNKPIGHFIHQGEKIIVQVAKDEIDTKAYRLTGNVEFSGQSIVYLPYGNYIAVSKKMQENSRELWKNWAHKEKQADEGFVIRTTAENQNVDSVQAELEKFREHFIQILKKAQSGKAPLLLDEKENFKEVVKHYIASESPNEIYCDKQEDYLRIKDSVEGVQFYRGMENIFTHFNIEAMLENLHRKTVWLENGANIVIEEAEAFTIIDVNSGKYSSGQIKENAVMEINQLAAREVARQIKLRNMSGMILVDFINMKNDKNKATLLQLLKDFMKHDTTTTTVYGFTSLGVVEMTRKRTKPSLQQKQEMTCPTCLGKGSVLSPESMALKLERELWQYRNGDVTEVIVEVTDDIKAFFTGEYTQHMKNLEETLNFKITIKSLQFDRPHYHIKRVSTN